MSDLQRAFAKAKLSSLPFDPPLPSGYVDEEDEEIEEMKEEEEEMEEDEDERNEGLRPLPEAPLAESSRDDDSSSASSSASSTGTVRPSPSKHLFARPKGFVGPVSPFY